TVERRDHYACTVASALHRCFGRLSGAPPWSRGCVVVSSRPSARVEGLEWNAVQQPGEGSAAPGSEREVRRGRKVGWRRTRAGKAVGEKRGAATGERGTASATR